MAGKWIYVEVYIENALRTKCAQGILLMEVYNDVGFEGYRCFFPVDAAAGD